jgi:hypothetical protein
VGQLDRLGGNWTAFYPDSSLVGREHAGSICQETEFKLAQLHILERILAAFGFQSVGGYCTSRPVAVFWGSGDAGLWHLSHDNTSRSNWTSISGNTAISGGVVTCSYN